ncbi:MAG: hypothetical protein ACRDT6_28175 [Micromonosporaceae bacterium]
MQTTTVWRILRRAALTLAAAVILILGFAQPASAHAETRGKACYGVEVPRCLWIHLYSTHSGISPQARIYDRPNDGSSYDVAVSNMTLQWLGPYGWNSYGENTEYDGWHPYEDVAGGPAQRCYNTHKYRVRALFKFKRPWQTSGTSEWRYSKEVYITCY